MPPELLPVAQYLIRCRYRLVVGKTTFAARLAREGDKLAGEILTEPLVACFDSTGRLRHKISVADFRAQYLTP